MQDLTILGEPIRIARHGISVRPTGYVEISTQVKGKWDEWV